MAFFDELLLQLKIVFDDAVVNDNDFSRTVAVRMSVLFRWAPVRSPTCVADAIGSVEGLKPDSLSKIAKLAFGAAVLQPIPVTGDGDTRRIVSAIFQPAKTVDNHRYYALTSDVPHNTAHTSTSGTMPFTSAITNQ